MVVKEDGKRSGEEKLEVGKNWRDKEIGERKHMEGEKIWREEEIRRTKKKMREGEGGKGQYLPTIEYKKSK